MLIVFLKHEAHFSFYELRKTLLHVSGDFSAVLAVTISDREKVAVFKAAEMWYSNPSVLVGFMRVRRGLPSFGSKCELSYTVCVHLFRVRRVKGILLALLGLTGDLALYLNGLTLFCCWELGCWHGLLRLGCRSLHVCLGLQSYWHLFGRDWMRLVDDRRFLRVSCDVSVVLEIKLGEFIRRVFCVFSNAVYVLDKTIKVRLWPLMPWSICQVSCIVSLILIFLRWNQNGFLLLNQSVWTSFILQFAELSHRQIFSSIIAMLTLTPLLYVLKQLTTLNFNLFFRTLSIGKFSVSWGQQAIQVIVLSGRVCCTRAQSLLVGHPAGLVRAN